MFVGCVHRVLLIGRVGYLPVAMMGAVECTAKAVSGDLCTLKGENEKERENERVCE